MNRLSKATLSVSILAVLLGLTLVSAPAEAGKRRMMRPGQRAAAARARQGQSKDTTRAEIMRRLSDRARQNRTAAHKAAQAR